MRDANRDTEAKPRRLSWLLRALIAAGLLYAIFSYVPLTEVASTIRGADPAWVALALALALLVSTLEAYRLTLPMKRLGLELTTWQVLEVNLAAKFYGLFVPGYVSGGLFRWYRFAGVSKRWTEVLASIAFNRMITTAVLVVLGLLFWSIDRPAGTSVTVGVVLLAMLAAIVAAHLLVTSPRATERGRRVLRPITQWRGLPSSIRDRLTRFVGSTVDHYRRFPGLLAPVAVLSFVGHLLGVAGFLCLARALGIDLSWVQVGWIRSVVVLLVMLPVSISGLGIREGSLLLLLPPLGVSEYDAVALSLLIFATALVVKSLGGLLEVRRLLFGRGRAGTLGGKKNGGPIR